LFSFIGVLCAGYAHLLKEEVTRSLAYVATKQHERGMKWFTPSNQTLQSSFPLLCEIVSRGQPNKMPKVVSASHNVILAPQRLLPGRQKGCEQRFVPLMVKNVKQHDPTIRIVEVSSMIQRLELLMS
jgi:hypothetical protein